jgi:hypothetical protein
MEAYLSKAGDLKNAGRKYARNEASEKISEASSLPREGLEEMGDPGGGESQTSESRSQVLQALGVVRGYCAMKPAEKIEEGSKKALAHNRTTQMVVHGFEDKDIHLLGVILAVNGHYALDMRDTAAMGIQDPSGKRYHRDDWKSNDGVKKVLAEH